MSGRWNDKGELQKVQGISLEPCVASQERGVSGQGEACLDCGWIMKAGPWGSAYGFNVVPDREKSQDSFKGLEMWINNVSSII